LLSYPIAQETVKALALRDEKGKPLEPEILLKSKKLKVKTCYWDRCPANHLYEDTDPKVVAAVVNKIMEAYISNNVVNNQAKAKAARIFISKELPNVEATVRQADAALRKFKEEE
jgi:succinoglycan biosynthesis transport protein ExoP